MQLQMVFGYTMPAFYTGAVVNASGGCGHPVFLLSILSILPALVAKSMVIRQVKIFVAATVVSVPLCGLNSINNLFIL